MKKLKDMFKIIECTRIRGESRAQESRSWITKQVPNFYHLKSFFQFMVRVAF